MTSIIVVSIALALASVVTANSGFPACNSLKPVAVDFQWLIRSSPVALLRGNSPIYQCGHLFFVGPAGDSKGYTGTGVVIKGNYTFSYDVNLIENSLFKTVLCPYGIKKDFRAVYKSSDPPSASLCVVSCNDSDATKYDVILCGGRTSNDEREVEKFIKGTLNGVKGIVNLQSGCPKPQNCQAFTN